MDSDLVKKLKDSAYFDEFEEFIIFQVSKLDSITGSKILELKNEEAGEMVKANARAIEILHSILEPLIDFRDKKEYSEKEMDEAKQKVGL